MSVTTPASRGLPAWLRELDISTSISPQVVLHGNIRDRYLVPGGAGPRLTDLLGALWSVAEASGYSCLIVHDPVDGTRCYPRSQAAEVAASEVAGESVRMDPSGPPTDPRHLPGLVRRVTGRRPDDTAGHRALLVLDYASRIDATSNSAHQLFSLAEKVSHSAVPRRGDDGARHYDQVVWLTDGDRDLPLWLTSRNAMVRMIAVPRPDLGDRIATARLILERNAGSAGLVADETDVAVRRFAAVTDGLGLRDLLEIDVLMTRLGTSPRDVEDAARSYRLGVVETPWRKGHLHDRLANAGESLARRVMGQEAAIQHSVDIVIRAAMGMSGAQASAGSTRPRGILFFAGPTGVGKTELAKAVTELVFGDESAYIRFDMSEFSAEHAQDRLIGAPPGYVGHDAGGELTNAVRQRPFSLVLFDEIEKAHPRILDKFLQILEDGRLTDGSGSTTYFTETLLVFTSNLGIYVDDGGVRRRNVSPGMDPVVAQERIKQEITRHFTETLNRPELLNRLGDNIVVFDHIRPSVATSIFEHLVERILDRVEREHGVTVDLTPEVREVLCEHACSDLDNGGRGIGGRLEGALVNPLARELFVRSVPSGSRVEVVEALQEGPLWRLVLR